jgi:hypothetical protein
MAVPEKENKKELAPEVLKEGVHYYFENGYMVFTGAYLSLRGYCCGNGCRHCPYGNSKTKEQRS